MENSAPCEHQNIEERELEMAEQIQMIHRDSKAETTAAEAATAAEECREEVEMMAIEKAFEGKRIPPWHEQLTFRAMAVSFFLSVMFSVIVMKFNLTTGIIPSLNVAAGLLGFFFVKMWTKILDNCGLLKHPFTRQENTIIQTCVVAAYDISFSGGFGNYLFGMSSRTANQSSNASSENIKEPQLGWMIGFLFLVSFVGLFSLVSIRKIMIIDYKLIYPSGTATAHLINGFHTPDGAKLAKKQVRTLGKFFVASFVWGFFQWFYTAGNNCGFVNFPTLGLEAYNNRFYFDFSASYVGTGMICSYLVNISILLGGVLSWGIMWPLIRDQSGSWYPAGLPDSDLRGLQSYQISISIAMILGDGLYNIFKVLSMTILAIVAQARNNSTSRRMLLSDNAHSAAAGTTLSFDDRRRGEVFLKDQIPKRVAFTGYVVIAAVSTATIPRLFPQLRWYHVLITYIFSPVLAFCNAYGCGLTDWSLSAIYGNLAIFVIGAWVGASHGGLIAGLAACGILMGIVSTASDLMQDFKTGYLTLSSPRSMFISQVIGTAMGCVIAPMVFWLFYKAFDDLGTPGSEYPAPFALVYRNVAIVGVGGLSSLPKHCLLLCYIFFSASILINLFRDTVGRKWAQYIPLPMAMAIPFYIGPYFAIDMCIGSLILFIWRRLDRAKADAFGMAVASGLICGDGIWALPQSVFALAQIKPPICMRFLSRKTSDEVDAFLSRL